MFRRVPLEADDSATVNYDTFEYGHSGGRVTFQDGRAKKRQTKEAKQDAGYFHDANSCKKNGHKNLLLAVRCRARQYRHALIF
jgi:hypothetical protein